MYMHTNSISETTVFAINYCNSIFFQDCSVQAPLFPYGKLERTVFTASHVILFMV